MLAAGFKEEMLIFLNLPKSAMEYLYAMCVAVQALQNYYELAALMVPTIEGQWGRQPKFDPTRRNTRPKLPGTVSLTADTPQWKTLPRYTGQHSSPVLKHPDVIMVSRARQRSFMPLKASRQANVAVATIHSTPPNSTYRRAMTLAKRNITWLTKSSCRLWSKLHPVIVFTNSWRTAAAKSCRLLRERTNGRPVFYRPLYQYDVIDNRPMIWMAK